MIVYFERKRNSRNHAAENITLTKHICSHYINGRDKSRKSVQEWQADSTK
jgi:hypothetical protein